MRIAIFRNARQQSIIQIQQALESRFARSSICVHKTIRSICAAMPGDVQSRRFLISNSWSSEPHAEWVAISDERLIKGGIDVVLDQWSVEGRHFHESLIEKRDIYSVFAENESVQAVIWNGTQQGLARERADRINLRKSLGWTQGETTRTEMRGTVMRWLSRRDLPRYLHKTATRLGIPLAKLMA